MSIRVLIYDDNEVFLHSLQTLLAEDPEFAATTMLQNAETVETDIEQIQPDVVLMDIDMPLVNGAQAVKRIRKINAGLPVIMLTVFDDNDNIFKAICAGASGYILKRFAAEAITTAIRGVLSGGAPMTGSVAKKVLQMFPMNKTTEQDHCILTTKEIEILRLLVSGYSYKMIADHVQIGIDGVRFHIKKIYDKLHVHSATEAVSKAIKDHLV